MVVRLYINDLSSFFPLLYYVTYIRLIKLNLILLNYIGCSMNKNLQYNFAMNIFMIIINIEAILYMRNHEIHVTDDYSLFLTLSAIIIYLPCGLGSCILWVCAITDVSLCGDAYLFGRISHNMGFIFFLELLYCISPYLALLIGLHVGLPCWLWYVTSMIGPSLWEGMQALRNWWKFVNKPQSVGTVQRGYSTKKVY